MYEVRMEAKKVEIQRERWQERMEEKYKWCIEIPSGKLYSIRDRTSNDDEALY